MLRLEEEEGQLNAMLLRENHVGWVLPIAKAVWNTSRIRGLADPAYQARLQAISSMAFTLGMLWAGIAIDSLGIMALVGGAAVLGLLSVVVVIVKK